MWFQDFCHLPKLCFSFFQHLRNITYFTLVLHSSLIALVTSHSLLQKHFIFVMISIKYIQSNGGGRGLCFEVKQTPPVHGRVLYIHVRYDTDVGRYMPYWTIENRGKGQFLVRRHWWMTLEMNYLLLPTEQLNIRSIEHSEWTTEFVIIIITVLFTAQFWIIRTRNTFLFSAQ